MPEQKMSYQERKEKEIEEFPYADIEQLATRSIERQAEAIREAVKCVNDYDTIDDESILSAIDNWIEEYLLEHGYIEPKTEGDERN